ncbi:MAG: DUF4105 domain-containing protein [Sulfurifustaceae bacterium]
MRRWWLFLILFALPAIAAANDYLDELNAAARAKKLADRIEWRALLHYKSRLVFPGMESQADDPDFFNAPDGKTNPEHELEATLAAFFSDRAETPTEQNPQCRFIARYQWLKRELRFDPARLPEQPCRRYQEWRATLNPDALTLVFPAAYLNNPASLYGHTLLRVDAQDQDERTRLLAYSINYAAATNETNGLTFAIKGIFGGYPGLFSMSPYYAKVTEYNDMENRDIWEYELNFTHEEIERLLMHAWELGPVRFDYYFFDENCAYHLLSLFDVARPELRLTDRFPLWVIPSDTVRVVAEEPGLLRRARYRPARSTILRYREEHMSAAQVQLARSIARATAPIDQPPASELPPVERARVLELAYEYLEYLRLRGETPDAAPTAARLRELLLARSRIDVAADQPPPVPTVRPDEGHGSARVGVGVGRENGRNFVDINLRPVYHDLLDPQAGYNRGAAIAFGNVLLRRREDDSTKIERIDIIDITSFSPRDALLQPLSWRVDFGFIRKPVSSTEDALVFRLTAGAGFAREWTHRSLWYALVEGDLNVADALESGYSLGAGPAAGALIDITDRWRVQIEGRALRYGAGAVHSATEASLRQRFTLGPRSALRFDLMQRNEFSQNVREGSLSWMFYF